MTLETGGMTVFSLQEKPLALHTTQTWSRQRSGWSVAVRLRSRAVMTLDTHSSIGNNRELSKREDVPLQNDQQWWLQKRFSLVQWFVPGKMQCSIWRAIPNNRGFRTDFMRQWLASCWWGRLLVWLKTERFCDHDWRKRRWLFRCRSRNWDNGGKTCFF